MKDCRPSPNHSFTATVLLLGIPYLLWLFLFRDLLSSHPIFIEDSVAYYRRIKFFMEGLVRGQFPLWQPLTGWGRPEGQTLRSIGEFNPFLLLIPLFKSGGLTYFQSYLAYCFIYFFTGLCGFYRLARHVLKDRLLAYGAYVCVVFSFLGFSVFYSYGIILLFVPTVWLFDYTLLLLRRPSRPALLGWTFWGMVTAVTYIPFYSLVLFVTAGLLAAVLYRTELSVSLKELCGFARRHRFLVILCVSLLVCAIAPGLVWYLDSAGDYVDTARQGWSDVDHPAYTNLQGINLGGLAAYTSVDELVRPDHADVHAVYVPLAVFLFLVLGLANRLGRLSVFLSLFVLVILVVSLTDVTPVHGWLYRHVFIFKIMRNLFFLACLALPALVLLAFDQLGRLLSLLKKAGGRKGIALTGLFLAHVLAGYFLHLNGGLTLLVFLTLAASEIFFVCYLFTQGPARRMCAWTFLLLTILIQPIGVVSAVSARSLRHLQHEASHLKMRNFGFRNFLVPGFRFVRPEKGETRDAADRDPYLWEQYGLHKGPYCAGAKLSCDLKATMDYDVLRAYAKNKFYLYDHPEFMPEDRMDDARLEKAMRDGDTVYVHSPDFQEAPDAAKGMQSPTRVLTREGPEFEILQFDMNTLKFQTRFDKERFLVYTDSYDPKWTLKINGRPAPLFRAMGAFKGIRLPAGSNTVELNYAPARAGVNAVLLALFYGFFIFYLVESFRDRDMT